MSWIHRFKKEEKVLKGDLVEEREIIIHLLHLILSKQKLIKHHERDVKKEFLKHNKYILEQLDKLHKLEKRDEAIIHTISDELDEHFNHELLNTELIQQGISRINKHFNHYRTLLEIQNHAIEDGDDLTKIINEEIQLEKDFDRTISNVLRDVHDQIINAKEKKPLISVVIPAYNEDKYIHKTVSSVKRQSYPNKEIIVIDNNSTDLTREHLLKYTVKEFVETQQGISHAKNSGAKKAKGEILVFLDADCIIDKHLLDKVYQAHLEGYPVCITRTIFDKNSFISKFFTHSQYLTRTLLLKIPAALMSVPKDIFYKVGGYDTNLRLGEDVDIIRKIAKDIGRDKIKILDSHVITSFRRFEQEGAFKTLGKWMYTLITKKQPKYDNNSR